MTASGSTLKTVGMLGLGSMGLPIAANLARKGFQVLAFDPRAEALDAARAAGVQPCASPAEVGRGAEVVFAIPFDYGQVEQSTLGPDGVVEGWAGSGLLVMMSTAGPDNARRLARLLAERGYRLLDAPVTGGAEGATAGTLTTMIGGAEADLALVRPALEAFTGRIYHLGAEAGAGQAAKMANQLLVVVHHVAAAEALLLGTRNGVDAEQLLEVLTSGSANSYILGHRGRAILDRSFKTGGSLAILVKDARLVNQAAESSATPIFAMAAAKQVFELASSMGLAGEDDAAVARAYELLLGRDIA